MRRALSLSLLGLSFACALVTTSALSAPMTRTNVDGFEVRGSGNTWSFGPASSRPGDGGYKAPPPAGAGQANLGKMQFFKENSGPMARATYPLAIPNSGGKAVDVLVKTPITKPSAGAAMAKFAFKMAVPITTGMAIYDLLTDLDLVPEWDAAAGKNVIKENVGGDELMCPTLSPAEMADITTAINNYVNPQSGSSTCTGLNYGVQIQGDMCSYGHSGGPCVYTTPGYEGVSAGAVPDTYGYHYKSKLLVPRNDYKTMTEQELADKIAGESGWPDSATIAMRDAIAAGESVETPPAANPAPNGTTASGPASTPGSAPTTKTETVTKPGTGLGTGTPAVPGTKTTTSTTTHNHSYSNNTITITTVTNNTSITNYADGTTEQDSSEEEKPEEPDATPAEDTDLPERGKLYEPKYPDGPGGVWNQKMELIKASPLFQLPSQLAPNLGDSGGCPVWSVPLGSFGVHDASIPCGVWTFLRICVLITSLWLARALIFGG